MKMANGLVLKTLKEYTGLHNMTFTDVLNDPVSRRMIDAIEDTISSLQSYPQGDEILQDVLTSQIKELREYNGYDYILQ